MRVADLKARNPHEISQAISLSRRDFLRTVTGAGAAAAFFGPAASARLAASKNRKAVVVTFGGGARDDETFAPDGQENIPHLLQELIPQATFLSNVVNKGILGHYVATASIVTGDLRDFQQLRCRLAQQSDGLRILPQRPEAARHGHLGGGAQQWIRTHRRERQQALRRGIGGGRDPSEAIAFGRPWLRRPTARATSTCSATTTRRRSMRPR